MAPLELILMFLLQFDGNCSDYLLLFNFILVFSENVNFNSYHYRLGGKNRNAFRFFILSCKCVISVNNIIIKGFAIRQYIVLLGAQYLWTTIAAAGTSSSAL